MSSQNSLSKEQQSLGDFFKHSDDSTDDSTEVIESDKSESEINENCDTKLDNSLSKEPQTQVIEVKSGTNYWVSDKVKQRKNAYMREYHKRKKLQQQSLIDHLKQHQIHGRQISLLSINNKQATREIDTEEKYLILINDLLATLQENGLLNDYNIEPLRS